MRHEPNHPQDTAIKAILTALLVVVAVLVWKAIAIQTAAEPDTADPLPAPDLVLPLADINDTRELELVNGQYHVGAAPDLGAMGWTVADESVGYAAVELRDVALVAVNQLIAEAAAAQAGTFYVGSGYRDQVHQAQIFDQALDKSRVQPPGHSEHQTGLAADVFPLGQTEEEMIQSSQGQWLADQAWRFGLILRYPAGLENLTGITYEPWHFRYVGQPHAWYCHTNNLAFEQYIEMLKTTGGYRTEYDGVEYLVVYQVPKDGTITVPANHHFSVSNDNTGGYIVTAWQ